MLDTPLPPALDRVRAELVSAAARRQQSERAAPRRVRARRRLRRLTVRPLLLIATGLLVAGTATAAIVVTSTTTGLDTNSRPGASAVSNISGVLRAVQQAGGAAARAPLSSGTIKGLTVTRDGISADVATNGTEICLAHRAGDAPTGESACAPLPIPTDRIPFVIGHDDARTWVVAIVPDGTTNVAATSTGGQSEPAEVTDNVAIAILPSGSVQRVSWTTPDGRAISQQPGKVPVVSSG